jgi:hypothetical protein
MCTWIVSSARFFAVTLSCPVQVPGVIVMQVVSAPTPSDQPAQWQGAPGWGDRAPWGPQLGAVYDPSFERVVVVFNAAPLEQVRGVGVLGWRCGCHDRQQPKEQRLQGCVQQSTCDKPPAACPAPSLAHIGCSCMHASPNIYTPAQPSFHISVSCATCRRSTTLRGHTTWSCTPCRPQHPRGRGTHGLLKPQLMTQHVCSGCLVAPPLCL